MIVDCKRGDISSTASAYAAAMFGGAPGFTGEVGGLAADAVTLSPYLGDDSLAPFVDYCESGRGLFVLARTSNPGAALLQEKEVDGRALFLHVAELIGRLGDDHVGAHGYSDVGAVVGATSPTSLTAVRAVLPRAFLLVPGFGAQGGTADALAGIAAGDALGYVVNASRSVIFAWQERGGDYRAAAEAAESMRSDLQDTL